MKKNMNGVLKNIVVRMPEQVFRNPFPSHKYDPTMKYYICIVFITSRYLVS